MKVTKAGSNSIGITKKKISKNELKQSNNEQNQSEIINLKGAQALRSNILAKGVAFRGNSGQVDSQHVQLTKYAIIIPDIASLPYNKNGIYSIKHIENPRERKKEKSGIGALTAPIMIQRTEKEKGTRYLIMDQNGPLADIKARPGVAIPPVGLEHGKPEANLLIEYTSPENNETAVYKIQKGSYAKGDGLDIRCLSKEQAKALKPSQSKLSFSSLYITEAHKPEDTETAVKEYFLKGKDKDFDKKSEFGAYAGKLKNKYNIIGTVGGFGSRFDNIGRVFGKNKPATPAAGDRKLLDIAVLDLGVKAGIIDGDKIRKAIEGKQDPSEKPEIAFIREKTARGNAGGVLDGVSEGVISTDESAVICSGDAYTGFDLSRVLHKFENSKAGMMVVGYPVSEKEIKDFGAIGQEPTSQPGIMRITSFIEKPQTLQAAKNARIEGKLSSDGSPMYVANIATSVAGKEILEVGNQIAQFTQGKEFDLSNNFVPIAQTVLSGKEQIDRTYDKYDSRGKLVFSPFELLHKAGLIDEQGNRGPLLQDIKDKGLELLTVPAESNSGGQTIWTDVGSGQSYGKAIYNTAVNKDGIYTGFPEEYIQHCKDSVDESGVVYISGDSNPAAFRARVQDYNKKMGITELGGNVIVIKKPQ